MYADQSALHGEGYYPTSVCMSRPILYVHSSNELYGSDIILFDLVRRLDRERFAPYVVMPEDLPYDGRLGRALAQEGIPHTSVDMAVLRRRYTNVFGLLAFSRRLLVGTLALRRIMRDRHVALVHSQTGAVWCGGLASRWLGVPHIYYIMEIIQTPRLTRHLMARFINAYGDRVVVISRAVGEHLMKDAPGIEERITVIPPGIDAETFHPRNQGKGVREEWGVRDDEVVFGVVARIHWWKGQDLFLRAAARIAREVPHARFVLVGDVVPGEEWRREALKREIARMGIGDRVVWAGYREDIPQVMAALDVLVLPSTEPEPFGRVIVEAMATERPVIASAHGGPVESVVHGETGLLFPPQDEEALAAAMKQLARDPDLRVRMGKAGRARVLEKYTVDRHVAAFQSLYEEILEGRDRS